MSGLKIKLILGEFLRKHLKATIRRIVYLYFLQDFSLASLNLLAGFLLFTFGSVFGLYEWTVSVRTGIPAGMPHLTRSTVMYRERRTENGKQAAQARGDSSEVTAG